VRWWLLSVVFSMTRSALKPVGMVLSTELDTEFPGSTHGREIPAKQHELEKATDMEEAAGALVAMVQVVPKFQEECAIL